MASATTSISPRIIKEGILYKRRNGYSKHIDGKPSWVYRFFTLNSDGIFAYYDSPIPIDSSNEEYSPRNTVDLSSVTFELHREPSIDAAPTDFAFVVQFNKDLKWKLCAELESDHKEWCLELDRFLPYYADGTKFGLAANLRVDVGSCVQNGVGLPISPMPVHAARDGASSSASTPFKVDAAPTLERRMSVSRRQKGKMLKLNRSVVSSELFDMTMLETFSAWAMINYCAYMAFMYHSGGFADTAFSSNVCLSWADLPLPTIISVEMGSLKWLPTLPSPGQLVSLLYALMGNIVLIVTLRLRYNRFILANTAKIEALSSSVTVDFGRSHSMSGMQGPESFNLGNEASPKERMSMSVSGEVSAGADDTDVPIYDDLSMVDGKPVPGYTMKCVTTPQRQSPAHSWSKIDHEEFHVRIGPNYGWNKKKAPSAHPLYDVFAVDVFSANSRIDHAAEKFFIPEKWANIDTGNNNLVPPVFVVQIQIPSDAPSFFSSVDNGPGWSICMFFAITDETLEQLKDLSTASPAVKLWAKWCEHAEKDKAWRARFKFIPSCSNLEELGVSSYIAGYNAKPILIRKTGSLFRGAGSKYMEFDMHIHKFDNIAKKSIHYMTAMCTDMFMQIGFVIEGQDDDELPEVLFGACALNRPQEDLCERIFD